MLRSSTTKINIYSLRLFSTNPSPISIYDNRIKFITIQNPKKGNILSNKVMIDLKKDLEAVQNDHSSSICVINSEGKYFCTGHDLKELMELTKNERLEKFHQLSEIVNIIHKLKVPVLSSVHGPAFAAGCQIVAACDLAIASSTATFSVPGIRLGLFCSTPGVSLSRAIGKRASAELLYTGKVINSARAYDLGLVHRICQPEDLKKETLEFAREVACHSAAVIRLGKLTFDEQVKLELEPAQRLAEQRMAENLELSDAKEGISSFIKKKSLPIWKHE